MGLGSLQILLVILGWILVPYGLCPDKKNMHEEEDAQRDEHEDLGSGRSTDPGGTTLISDFWLQDSETRVLLLKTLLSVVLMRLPQETHTRSATSLPAPCAGLGTFLLTPVGVCCDTVSAPHPRCGVIRKAPCLVGTRAQEMCSFRPSTLLPGLLTREGDTTAVGEPWGLSRWAPARPAYRLP